MKSRFTFIFVLTLMLNIQSVLSQDSCRVLVPESQGSYEGGCKKGLANGQGTAIGEDRYQGEFRKGLPDGMGTYYWSNGAVYYGQWSKGRRNGSGVYTFRVDGRDSILTGVWKNDIFVGKAKTQPTVAYRKNIESYYFFNSEGLQDRVLIDFRQNGMQNSRVENLMLDADSGMPVQVGQKYGFDNVVFPITVSVRYDTYNKMGTQRINVVLQFTVYDKGDWEVVIKN